MAKAKKSSSCPIAEALSEIEKMNENLDKQLAKDAAKCSKQLESAKKKMKKLADAKAKATAKKKSAAAKVKAKPTAAGKAQLEKAKAAASKANDSLAQIKEEISGLTHVMQKCTRLMKRRKAEAKLIEKFHKDEAKKEALKLKKKVKPKKKVAKKASSTPTKPESMSSENQN